MKKYLILLNPTSGQKLAEKYYQKYVVKTIDENKNDNEFEVIRTEFAGHSFDLAKNGNLSTYDGIITISGDGLIFEIINGLYQRSDWNEVMDRLRFGIVAGGTGNSLTCSLSLQLNQSLDDLGVWSSIVNVRAGIKNPKKAIEYCDLIEVEQRSQSEKVVSFLGIAIGLIADVDIGTEWMRCMGYLRAYVMVIWRIIKPKPYHVKVSYLPLEKDSVTGVPISVPNNDQRTEMPNISAAANEPLPKGWVSETDSYYLIYAENLPLLDSLTLMAPESRTGDGIIWLVLVRERMSRVQMIHWLLNAENAAHIGKPGVEIIPVRAFRLDPIYPEGYLTIDGENYPFGPVQGQMLPGKINLLADTNKSD